FPETGGAFDTTQNGGIDAFVARIDAAGASLGYATFLGGSGDDRGFGVAVNKKGNAYVAGTTSSTQTTFPVTAGAFDTSQNGGTDEVLSVVQAPRFLFTTYLGGSGDEQGNGVAVDIHWRAFTTGGTTSTESTFPDTSGVFDGTSNGGRDAFVATFQTH